METNRCYGCMKRKNNSPVCEHCGYDDRQGNDSHQMPAGTVLQGKYLVGRVLGQGGFGITYLGWDLFLDIPVAIKEYYPSGVVMRDSAHSLNVSCSGGERGERFAKNRERFLREAKSLARFESTPEIVKVSNYFLDNNTAYIIMEFVEGVTLKQHVKQHGGRLSPEETFAILRPILKALENVHETGLVHRDISPDNIMLLPGGGVKLIDFGAVRDVQNADAENPLTKSTEAILKQGYAPIEQYQKRGSLGPWTDVYALCATIYYCLTGRVPMDAPERVLGEEDFSWDSVPGLAPQQRAALEKGMALLPKDRTQSVKQLYDDLFAEKQAPVPVPAPAPKPRPWGRMAAAALLVLTVIGLIGATVRGNQKQEPEPVLQETTAATQTVETEPAETTAPTQPETQPWEKNVLKAAEGTYYTDPVYGMEIQRQQVGSVTFLDTVADAPLSSIDVSEAGDGSVLAWFYISKNGREYDLYIAGEGGINGANACKGLFSCFTALERVSFNGAFHTELATDMSSMFSCCQNLKEVDVENLDTSSAESISHMFFECMKLTELDLSHFDTSNVTDMVSVFGCCYQLTKLDVHTWNTANVERMRMMFQYCTRLESLDLSSFDTSKVISMYHMFENCRALRELDISGFDISNVAGWEDIFGYCPKVPWSVKQQALATAEPEDRSWEKNVLKSNYPEDGASYDSTLYGSGAQRDQIVSVTFLDTVENAPLSSIDASEAGDGSVLVWLNVSGNGREYDLFIAGEGGVNGVNACEWLFGNFGNLKQVNFNGAFHTETTKSFESMFSGCGSLTEIDVSTLDTSSAENLSSMFGRCTGLTELDLNAFDTSNVKEMYWMFGHCYKLETIHTQTWDTSNVESMSGMFSYCSRMEALDLSHFDTSSVTTMGGMFYHCRELKELNISGWNTSKVTDMSEMFWDCPKLTTLDVSHLDTSNVTDSHAFMTGEQKVNGEKWMKLFS